MVMWTHKITLCWYGELHIIYTNSVSDARALPNAIAQLANKLQVSKYKVRQYYNNGKANYHIERNKNNGRCNY